VNRIDCLRELLEEPLLITNLVNVPDDPPPSVIYTWFVDVQDPYGSADRADHDAAPGEIQDVLRDALTWTSRTALFHVWVYVLLSLLLLPFCVRDRAFRLLRSRCSRRYRQTSRGEPP